MQDLSNQLCDTLINNETHVIKCRILVHIFYNTRSFILLCLSMATNSQLCDRHLTLRMNALAKFKKRHSYMLKDASGNHTNPEIKNI